MKSDIEEILDEFVHPTSRMFYLLFFHARAKVRSERERERERVLREYKKRVRMGKKRENGIVE